MSGPRSALVALAQPCVVLGLTAVILFGGFYAVQAPRAEGLDRLAVDVAGIAALATGVWLVPQVAALRWGTHGGLIPLVTFLGLGPVAAAVVAGILFTITEHALGALVGLVLAGWMFTVELVVIARESRRC